MDLSRISIESLLFSEILQPYPGRCRSPHELQIYRWHICLTFHALHRGGLKECLIIKSSSAGKSEMRFGFNAAAEKGGTECAFLLGRTPFSLRRSLKIPDLDQKFSGRAVCVAARSVNEYPGYSLTAPMEGLS